MYVHVDYKFVIAPTIPELFIVELCGNAFK